MCKQTENSEDLREGSEDIFSGTHNFSWLSYLKVGFRFKGWNWVEVKVGGWGMCVI